MRVVITEGKLAARRILLKSLRFSFAFAARHLSYSVSRVNANEGELRRAGHANAGDLSMRGLDADGLFISLHQLRENGDRQIVTGRKRSTPFE